MLLYSQYLQEREMISFPPGTVGIRSWAAVIEKLKSAHKGDVEVAVYPCAGIQHEMAVHDIPEGA
jgi:hypothetical protein